MLKIYQYLDKAFRVIRRNYGCPGPNGLSIKYVKKDYTLHRNILANCLQDQVFEFSEPRETQIVDYQGRVRSIFVYNIYDRWVQQALRLSISPIVENVLEPCVFGYRRGYTDSDVYDYILNSNPQYVVTLDVLDFFLNINKDVLIQQMSLMKFPVYVQTLIENSIEHTEQGLPVGNCLSPMLSNLYLAQLDSEFGSNYARFSDDLFWGVSSVAEAQCVIDHTKYMLELVDLKLNERKIRIIPNPSMDKIAWKKQH